MPFCPQCQWRNLWDRNRWWDCFCLPSKAWDSLEWRVHSWDWGLPSADRPAWKESLFRTPLWTSGASGHLPSARSGTGSTRTKRCIQSNSSWSSKPDLRCKTLLFFVEIQIVLHFLCWTSSCSIFACSLVLISLFPVTSEHAKLIFRFSLPIDYFFILLLFSIILLWIIALFHLLHELSFYLLVEVTDCLVNTKMIYNYYLVTCSNLWVILLHKENTFLKSFPIFLKIMNIYINWLAYLQ